MIGKNIYAEPSSSWKLIKNSDGIQIESRKEAGSEYHSFQASIILKTNLDTILSVLKKVDQYPDWFAFTKAAFLIRQSRNEQTVFLETNFPWPYQNEFMEYRMVFLHERDGRIKVTIDGISKPTDRKEGLFPLKKASGSITLYPHPSETKTETKFVYFFHSEPRQEIPTWLINPMIHEMPFQTLLALQKRVTKD